jgi:hypothetical protein
VKSANVLQPAGDTATTNNRPAQATKCNECCPVSGTRSTTRSCFAARATPGTAKRSESAAKPLRRASHKSPKSSARTRETAKAGGNIFFFL